MTLHQAFTLDENGLPILTDIIPATVTGTSTELPADSLQALSAEEIAETLLRNESFRQQLDKIAAKLTITIRQQMENAIRPAIGEVITQALNTSGDSAYRLIGQQLEHSLPAILALALQQESKANR
jgi:hypothetical protein